MEHFRPPPLLNCGLGIPIRVLRTNPSSPIAPSRNVFRILGRERSLVKGRSTSASTGGCEPRVPRQTASNRPRRPGEGPIHAATEGAGGRAVAPSAPAGPRSGGVRRGRHTERERSTILGGLVPPWSDVSPDGTPPRCVILFGGNATLRRAVVFAVHSRRGRGSTAKSANPEWRRRRQRRAHWWGTWTNRVAARSRPRRSTDLPPGERAPTAPGSHCVPFESFQDFSRTVVTGTSAVPPLRISKPLAVHLPPPNRQRRPITWIPGGCVERRWCTALFVQGDARSRPRRCHRHPQHTVGRGVDTAAGHHPVLVVAPGFRATTSTLRPPFRVISATFATFALGECNEHGHV